MRRQICINISRKDQVEIVTKLKDITIQDITKFNPKHAHIVGAAYNWDYDFYCIYLAHNEFPVIPEGTCVKRYNLEEARRKYPYLFVDTNSLLHRKFGLG